MTEDDYIVRMPPVREYTVRVRIKSIEKGVPRFVGLEDEFWREEYICPICLNKKVLCDPAPQCCGHYMVEFEVWEKDKAAFLRSREYTLALEKNEGGNCRMDELVFLAGDQGPSYLVVEKVGALEFLSNDALLAERVLLTNELTAWDKLSDEALEEFEKLVEESESGQPRSFLDKIRYWTVDDWKDWLMGR